RALSGGANGGRSESLELRLQSNLRGDEHPIARATRRHPPADNGLRFAASVTRDPHRIHVRSVDEVAARRCIRIEHRKRLPLVGGPPKDVATKTERENVEGRVRNSYHRSVH